MEFDPFVLSRIQFAANISFHILFPSVTIGLGWFLVYFRIQYLRTNDKSWEYAYFSWVKIFALTFALGVVSGITMSFQFGTNWPGFMEKVGNIAGPLLGYEVLTAFFMEASFLGIMLFGKDRVSERVHLISTVLVAVGTTFSAFWILSLNSWMQTPAGYEIRDGIFYATDWWQIIFNPSFPYRMTHMLLASLLTSAFMIAGISAGRILKCKDGPSTWLLLRTSLIAAAVLAPTQILVGDLHGLNSLEHQPAKIAAVEAIWETGSGVPFTLVGMPNEETKTTDYAIEIPKLASLVLVHDAEGELPGLDQFEGEHPPVAAVFWSFRVMVGVGMLMLIMSWYGCWKLWRNSKFSKIYLRLLAPMAFSGWVAVLAGWYVTEIGRQPWVVYGLLRSRDVVAEHSSEVLLGTLIGYLTLYVFLLISYIGALAHLSSKPPRSGVVMHEYHLNHQGRS